jgi:hypothetical protein
MKYLITVAITLFFTVTAFAHTDKEVENELVSLHSQIKKYSSYQSEYTDDSDEKLAVANKAFRDRLLEVTAQHSSLLRYDFPVLSEEIQIKTSADSALKVYTWDTETGGTMHFYDAVYQFRGVGGVFSLSPDDELGDPDGFVTDVFDIVTKTGTVYLVNTTSRLSTSYNGQSVSAFRIDGNKLADGVKIFKTGSGTTNSISFGYDFFSVVDREERPVRLFEYDSKSKTLSFPVVIEDGETPQGRVTDKKIRYRFNGEYFVKVRG